MPVDCEVRESIESDRRVDLNRNACDIESFGGTASRADGGSVRSIPSASASTRIRSSTCSSLSSSPSRSTFRRNDRSAVSMVFARAESGSTCRMLQSSLPPTLQDLIAQWPCTWIVFVAPPAASTSRRNCGASYTRRGSYLSARGASTMVSQSRCKRVLDL